MHLQAKISVLFIVAALLCSKQTGENSSIVPSNGKTIQSFTPGFTRYVVYTFFSECLQSVFIDLTYQRLRLA